MSRNKEIRDPNIRLKALFAEAEKHELEIGIPLKLYFRAAQNLLNSMYSYLDDEDIESAFILASKFTILFIDKLPNHPDYQSISHEIKSKWKKEVNKALNGAQKMKVMILETYRKQEEDRQLEEKIQQEINRNFEEEKRKLAEKKWLEEQEKDMTRKERENFDNLEKFVSEIDKNVIPDIDRALKPVIIVESNNKYDWRTLRVPSTIFKLFLNIAHSNTLKNIETCGILCGKVSSGKLIITTVLIPKQSGTSDSCSTDHEEELFDFVDQKSLITLGWIHTHPTQTAFLSSVDLHTQFSYQIMLQEAIAIVCSPKYQQNSFFSLTPNYGLSFIKNCKSSGFHPHPSEPKLFEESPHVKLTDELTVEFCDFRNT